MAATALRNLLRHLIVGDRLDGADFFSTLVVLSFGIVVPWR